MKFSLRQLSLAQIIQQRNFSFCVSGVLLASNLFLSLKVLSQEEKWVLIPQFNIDHRSTVTTSTFSDEYLIDWADALLRDWLTVNPSTVESKSKRFLQVAAQSYGDLRERTQKTIQKIKEERLSTVFYPKAWYVDQKKKKVRVIGDFLTFFGTDREPVRAQEAFTVHFERGPNGVILCTDIIQEEGA